MAAEMVAGESITSDAEALAKEAGRATPQAVGTLGAGTQHKETNEEMPQFSAVALRYDRAFRFW